MPSMTPELFTQICDEVAVGVSVDDICARNDMPSKDTFYKYKRKNPDAADEYARAKDDMVDYFEDEIIEIADNSAGDVIPTEDGFKIDGDAIQRAKLRIDSRKWVMGKRKPKKYGDKVTHAGDAENPIHQVTKVVNVSFGDDE